MSWTCCQSCCPGAQEQLLPIYRKHSVSLKPAELLWSTERDKPVKLRMSESGPGSEAPSTIHQMFQRTVDGHGDEPALRWKEDGKWITMTYKEYLLQCRSAAKSFLKVGDYFVYKHATHIIL